MAKWRLAKTTLEQNSGKEDFEYPYWVSFPLHHHLQQQSA
jgi:hypothetical protein